MLQVASDALSAKRAHSCLRDKHKNVILPEELQ
jgi:hypothetical protein